MKNFSIFILSLLLSSSSLLARNWQTVKIPGAVCGNGQDYKVWIDKKADDKLIVEFMGGGVCWSLETCYGPKLRTILFSLPRPLPSMMASENAKKSPFNKHSMIYFPYCNGDVFAGTHTKKYRFGKVHHQGYNNVVKTFKYLQSKNIMDLKSMEDVTLYGASAGGIASFIHTKTIEPFVADNARKTVISDSPGLHFGKTFWQKFTNEMNADIMSALNKVKLFYSLDDGFVAPYIDKVCHYLNDWNIGILQGSRDIIMSVVFGDSTMQQHHDLVFGPRGLFEMTQGLDNCASWTPETKMHTFLLLKSSGTDIKPQGMSALEFANDIYAGNLNNSYIE